MQCCENATDYSLLLSFVSSFLSQICSVSSSSCLFDYLFAHQCQSSAVANVPSSSPGRRLCFWELPEAIQTANILHYTNMQAFSIHTKTFKCCYGHLWLKYSGQTIFVQFCGVHWMNTAQWSKLTLLSMSITIKASQHFFEIVCTTANH